MWVGTAYCGPVAINVVPVALNVGRSTSPVANNVVPKWVVIVGPSESYCGPLQVGSIVIAKRRTGVCEIGEVGVCYECYTLDDRPGWSFIFQQGRYDGFSPDEVELMLHVTGQVCPEVTDYHFLNVMRLTRDYQEGYFNSAFTMVASAPMPPKPM